MIATATPRGARRGEDPVAVPHGFEIHGHRGARGYYPENTIEGFVAAIADGADVLETDVLSTRDGALVLHHDYEPNPETTRDASGRWLADRGPPIYARTYAELAAFDVGRLRPGCDYQSRFPHQQGRDGARIPTLADALTAVDHASGGTTRWNLEIKIATQHPGRSAAPEAVADATVALVRERGLEARVRIHSFDWRVVRRVQAIAPAITTGCLTAPHTIRSEAGDGPSPYTAGLDLADFGGSVPRLAHAAGCTYWAPEFRMLTRGDVEEAHRLGLRVVPYTVNEPDDLRAVVALGVDGLITDYPDRLARS